jgi:four helix bundle protein
MNESPIFARTYELVKWIIPMTVKYPRHQRFVLATAMQQAALALQANLIEAVRLPDTAHHLRLADVELDKLRTYLRLSHDLGYMSLGQQRHAGQMVTEIGRMLGSWQNKVGGRAGDAARGFLEQQP